MNTSEALQSALNAAARSPEDDRIQLTGTRFNGNFVYADGRGDLILEGGFRLDVESSGAACIGPPSQGSPTVLDAGGAGRVLDLDGARGAVTLRAMRLTGGAPAFGETGAALRVETPNEALLERVQIVANELNTDGRGTAGADLRASRITIRATRFLDNALTVGFGNSGGAALRAFAPRIRIQGSTFIDNRTTGSFGGGPGGALIFSNGNVEIVNNVFTGNSTALEVNAARLRMLHNTIVDNDGAGLELSGFGVLADDAQLDWLLGNNILWSNSGTDAGGFDVGGFVPLDRVDFDARGNLVEVIDSDIEAFFGDSNRRVGSVDFVDRASGDFRLNEMSPLVDAGSETVDTVALTDRQGRPREIGQAPDIGAFETTVADFSPPGGQSGAWFDPRRAGEGFVVEILSDDRARVSWFTYSPDGEQAWIIGNGRITGNTLLIRDAFRTRAGVFGEGFDASAIEFVPWGGLLLRFENCSRTRLRFVGPTGFGRGRQVLRRLTRIAGLPCDRDGEAVESLGISGAWFDPDRSGEGLVVEELPDGRARVSWFTYRPEGGQAWMVGNGPIEGNRVVIDDAFITRGGAFGDAFDPAAIEFPMWGELTLQFTSCSRATFDFDPVIGEFHAGKQSLIRLTRLAGAECRL